MNGSWSLSRVFRFALVGATATVVYGMLAWASAVMLAIPASLASVTSYALAAVVSYFGHRALTFRSGRPHLEAAPRFAGLSIVGYVIAFATPGILTDVLKTNPAVPILVTSLAVPLVNAVALSRLVFTDRLEDFEAPVLRSRCSSDRRHRVMV